MDETIRVEVDFGLKEAKAIIKFDEEVVATVTVKQDPDALNTLKSLVDYMTAER